MIFLLAKNVSKNQLFSSYEEYMNSITSDNRAYKGITAFHSLPMKNGPRILRLIQKTLLYLFAEIVKNTPFSTKPFKFKKLLAIE
jgi:hypothetical protein